MGIFEILSLAGFVLLFLFIIDHGSITLKSLRNRWAPSKTKAAKVLPLATSRMNLPKTVKTV